MDGRPTWTYCDEAGDYVVPNVLSPRDLVSRPDNMDETVPHTGREDVSGPGVYFHSQCDPTLLSAYSTKRKLSTTCTRF